MRHHITLSVAQYFKVKFSKKSLGESDVEAVLQKLGQLTKDEARMTFSQTLGVVHDLVRNVRVVMEGAQRWHGLLLIFSERYCIRWQGVDRWYSAGVG